ncbi:MAG: C40 family peptidase [Alloprevotella sp.]|nr:C40 family peptidase [Alloprevotella sp.]
MARLLPPPDCNDKISSDVIFKKTTAVFAAALFVVCSAAGAPVADPVGDTETPEASVSTKGTSDRIIDNALRYLGTRYRRGTAGPKTFDCSGFTSFLFKKENISLSRCSRDQYRQGEAVRGISNLRRGDLVFFGGSRATRSVGHVGIVMDVAEDGRSFTFVHAACSGVKVDKSTSSYYSRRYIGARRILQND